MRFSLHFHEFLTILSLPIFSSLPEANDENFQVPNWTMEVYIGNIVVKSETLAEYTQHMEEAFCLMRAYNMKLNPAKCTFGVSAR